MNIKSNEKEKDEVNHELEAKNAGDFIFSETVCHPDFAEGCIERDED